VVLEAVPGGDPAQPLGYAAWVTGYSARLAAVKLGLGRIVALYCFASSLHRIH
jgi:hypothetical protein